MKTTLELNMPLSPREHQQLQHKLYTLPRIFKVSISSDEGTIAVEYSSHQDLEMVCREIRELGFKMINDTHDFDFHNPPQ